MPCKNENVYQIVYLLCDNESFEKSLLDLDTTNHYPEFKDPSENVSTCNEVNIYPFPWTIRRN